MRTSPAAYGPGAEHTLADASLVNSYLKNSGTTLGLLTIFLVVLRLVSPRFFYVDDKVSQYVPMFRWLGLRLRDGVLPPLYVPDLGKAGNLSSDLQYGVMDPVHWFLAWLISFPSDLNDAAWILSVIAIIVMGLGIAMLLTSFRLQSLLVVIAAAGVPLTGGLLWIGATWWPVAWGLAWIPWLWWALLRRGPLGAVATAVFSYMVASAGYIYVLPLAAVLVIAVITEQTRWQSSALRGMLWGLVAGALGALAALPGIATAALAQPVSERQGFYTSSGRFVVNGFDALLGGPTLMPNLTMWEGSAIQLVPFTASLALALPLVAFVDWGRAVRGPGFLTAASLAAVSLVATQLPEQVYIFKYSMRFLAETGMFIPLLVVVSTGSGLVFSRRRYWLAGGLVAASVGLSVFRTPGLWEWHALAALLMAGGTFAIVVYFRSRGRVRCLAAGVALLVTVAAPLLGVQASSGALTVPDKEGHLSTSPFPSFLDWPTDVDDIRSRSAVLDQTGVTVYRWSSADERSFDQSFRQGNTELVAGNELGYGYTSIGQKYWSYHLCQDFLGSVGACDDADRRMLEIEPTTGVPWIDLMTASTVVLSPEMPETILAHFSAEWDEVEPLGSWRTFERREPLPNGVTYISSGLHVESSSEGDELSYVVSSQEPGIVVFRYPWWSGLSAHLTGGSAQIDGLDDTLLLVEIPAGVKDAELTISFDPWPSRLAVPAGIVALLGVAACHILIKHEAARSNVRTRILRRPDSTKK